MTISTHPESSVGVSVVSFSILDRLDRLLQTESGTETEEQVEEEEELQQEELSARAEELQNKQSIEQASYETKRDAILTNNFLLSVLESSFFQHDVFIQQENALAELEKSILDTTNELRELKQKSSNRMLSAIGATVIEEELTQEHYPTLISFSVELSTQSWPSNCVVT